MIYKGRCFRGTEVAVYHILDSKMTASCNGPVVAYLCCRCCCCECLVVGTVCVGVGDVTALCYDIGAEPEID